MGLTIAQLSERLPCAECGGQLHSVKPWRMVDVLGKPLGRRGWSKNQRPPAANLSSASQSISVAVCVPAVPWGRERSSRIVSLATGYPALSFSGIKRRTDANGIMPTGILDPLRDGWCRGRAENEASNRHRCVPKFHGTPHRGLAVLAYYRTPRGSASTDERPRLHSPL